MPSKRKYDSKDAFSTSEAEDHRTPSRSEVAFSDRRRLVVASNATASPSVKTSHEKHSSVPKQPSNLSSCEERRKARLAAELADLADYNAPPKPRRRDKHNDSDGDEEESISSLRRRSDRKPAKETRVQKAASKPKSKQNAKPTKTRTTAERLAAEITQLAPWCGRPSEGEDSSSDDDDSAGGSSDGGNRPPRSHSRKYPPKQAGVQNRPWSELPPEIRNAIYECCMANEEAKSMNVIHYPNGVPRRSMRGVSEVTNFAHSHWGFTQTCKQVRNELTPCLLKKRYNCTPIGTLNKYVEAFHRPHPTTGERIGHIEPFCTQAPLPGYGVEIAILLKLEEENKDFHLHLSPTNISPEILALQLELYPGQYDELSIIKDIAEWHRSCPERAFASQRIEAIRISSVEQSACDDEEEDPLPRILLTLDIHGCSSDWVSRDNCLVDLVCWLFNCKVAEKVGVKVKASFAGGRAYWIVRRHNVVDMLWKNGERKLSLRHFMNGPEDGIEEEDL